MADAEEVAGIAPPEGDPDAIDDATLSLLDLAMGFEHVAQRFRAAAASMPSWTGRAADAARATLEGLALAGDGSREACLDAHVGVKRYAQEFREAHERVKRLQDQAEQAKRERDDARRLAGEAGERAEAARTRAEAARTRAEAALLEAALDPVGLAAAEHRRALGEAEAEEDEQARRTQRAEGFQEELTELRAKAARAREAAREAEDRAESQVIAAEGRFPVVPTVAGGGPAAATGGAGWPFAGPLLPGGALLGRPSGALTPQRNIKAQPDSSRSGLDPLFGQEPLSLLGGGVTGATGGYLNRAKGARKTRRGANERLTRASDPSRKLTEDGYRQGLRDAERGASKGADAARTASKGLKFAKPLGPVADVATGAYEAGSGEKGWLRSGIETGGSIGGGVVGAGMGGLLGIESGPGALATGAAGAAIGSAGGKFVAGTFAGGLGIE